MLRLEKTPPVPENGGELCPSQYRAAAGAATAHSSGCGPRHTAPAAGDNEHTGHYRVAQRRRDPNWVVKTRPGQSGEPVKTMPPEQERTNPYANRRFMGGGAAHLPRSGESGHRTKTRLRQIPLAGFIA